MSDDELLGMLFGATPAPSFFADHWFARPYFLARNAPGFFGALLARSDIETLLNCSNARYPEISLAVADRKIPPARYATEQAINGVTIHAIDSQAVARLFAGGASVLLRAAHTGLPRVMSFTRRLEALFRQPMTAICFVSPPGSASFPRHTDPSGTLVLQLAGAKHWLVDAEQGASGPRLLTMEPGSVLYLPPEWPHFVTSGDSVSISLNYAIQAPSARDVLQRAVARVLSDAAFDAAMDPHARSDALPELAALLCRRLAALDAAELARLLEQHFEQQRLPGTPGFQLSDLDIANEKTIRR